jgi:hypothetical protein
MTSPSINNNNNTTPPRVGNRPTSPTPIRLVRRRAQRERRQDRNNTLPRPLALFRVRDDDRFLPIQ